MEIKTIGSVSAEKLLELSAEPLAKQETENKENPSKEELKELKKENRFYLPVLNINHADAWPAKPKSERKHFTEETAMETCLSNCCGVSGLKSACCRMDPNDLEHVLGPVDEKWIKSIIKWFRKKGLEFGRSDIVIDFEEGKIIGENIFNGHKIFQDPKAYPILRFQVDGSHYTCKWLNPTTGFCGIYNIRPSMCKNYLCQYVKSNFLVKTKENPNTWVCLNPSQEKEK